MKRRIGVASIGQIPRPDINDLILQHLGPEFEVLQRGALDGKTYPEIQNLHVKDTEYILMAGMRNEEGVRRGVKVTREYLTPLLQTCVDSMMKEGAELVIIWCAGRFPEFKSNKFVVRPSEVIKGVTEALLKRGRLGVIYPSPLQLIWANEEFHRPGVEVYSDSPQKDESINKLGTRLAQENLDLIVLNCAGFGSDMKNTLQKITGKPVLQGNVLTLRVVKEILGNI